MNDSVNSIEIELSSLRTDVKEKAGTDAAAKESREKVLEAKIEDLSDRLRLGMYNMQNAIGETRKGGQTGTTVSLEEAEAVYGQDIEGVKESMANQVR